MYFLRLFLVGILAFLSSSFVNADETLVYIIPLQQEIDASTWVYLQEGFKEAEKQQADAVLLHMNTYGGEVLYADSIRTRILNSPKPVYVYIDNNAASAGALISIACDKIFMRRGANIGAATVVNGIDGQAMPDKYQSYMRATIRATAEAKGMDTVYTVEGDTLTRWRRDPKIAEAMVDESIYIEGVVDSGKILTFTALEAMEKGFCDGLAESRDEAISLALQSDQYRTLCYEPTLKDRLKGFLLGTFIRSLLIMIIVGGIYFELQTPGVGFPIAASLVATLLYFIPLCIDGMAAYWEILLFLLGCLLLLAEFFIFPGFGVAGISGILLVSCGLLLGLIDNDWFNFSGVNSEEFVRAMMTVIVGITGSFFLIIALAGRIGKGALRRIALDTSQEVEKGYLAVDKSGFSRIGEEGICKTDLRPSGKVVIKEQVIDAVASFGYIEQGERVRVARYEHGQIYVEKYS